MITIGTTILAINPNAQFRIVDNNLDTIEWLNETKPIRFRPKCIKCSTAKVVPPILFIPT